MSECEHCKHGPGCFVGFLMIVLFCSVPFAKYLAEQREKKLVAECKTTGEVRHVYESRANLWPTAMVETEYACPDGGKVWLQR